MVYPIFSHTHDQGRIMRGATACKAAIAIVGRNIWEEVVRGFNQWRNDNPI
jgi:hypothetical protein